MKSSFHSNGNQLDKQKWVQDKVKKLSDKLPSNNRFIKLIYTKYYYYIAYFINKDKLY